MQRLILKKMRRRWLGIRFKEKCKVRNGCIFLSRKVGLGSSMQIIFIICYRNISIKFVELSNISKIICGHIFAN